MPLLLREYVPPMLNVELVGLQGYLLSEFLILSAMYHMKVFLAKVELH